MPSSLIPAQELTDMRAAAELTFPDSCIVKRLAEVSDSQGGFTQSWAAVGTVDCRLVAKSGNTRSVAANLNATGAYTLTVPHDKDIREADVAVVDSVTFRVYFLFYVMFWLVTIRADVYLEVS